LFKTIILKIIEEFKICTKYTTGLDFKYGFKDENIKILNSKHKRLRWLECSDNQLTALPELPLNTELYCSDNKLTALPELPLNKYLDCFLKTN